MISIIQTTYPKKETALKIGKTLLEMNLVACTHVREITSQYIWKDQYHEETEFALYVKTSEHRKKDVIKYINNEHPYEIPYIASQDQIINNAYKSWMDAFLS